MTDSDAPKPPPPDTYVSAEKATASVGSEATTDHPAGASPPAAPPGPPPVDEALLLSGRELYVVFVGLLLGILLIALDQTIVATAIPVIASHFNSLGDVTWIIGAYLLTQVAFMLTYGQALVVFPAKWVFLFAITIFEIGSLLCAVATSSPFLIFGRALAGVGSGGVVVAVFTIIASSTRIEQRPMFLSVIGALFAISSCVGPLIGGAFTEYVSWRWCFYINLPVGAVAVTFISFFLKIAPPMGGPQTGRSLLDRLLSLDWVGSFLCLGFTVCVVLPLQWGGNERPWSDAGVIAPLCVAGAIVGVLLLWEHRLGERGILPLRLLWTRTQAGACVVAFFTMASMILYTYYLPLQYQAVQGHSATKSGIDILPYILAIVASGTLTGALVQATGRYWPVLVASPALTAVGAGLLHTARAGTRAGTLAGFQVLLGAGLGGGMQNTLVAVQADAGGPHLVPLATGLLQFWQFLGGSVGIAAAGAEFNNALAKALARRAPDVDPGPVRASVTVIRQLPVEQQDAVIRAYVEALDNVYLIGVPAAALAILGALVIRNLNLKKLGPPGAPPPATA